MLLRIEDIYWKLQKKGSFEKCGQSHIQRGGKGQQDTRALRVAGILVPVIAALVTFLGAGAFLHIHATAEKKENCEENST